LPPISPERLQGSQVEQLAGEVPGVLRAEIGERLGSSIAGWADYLLDQRSV
jgi:hypothetical protein